MNKKEKYNELIAKYLDASITDQELEEFQQWLKADPKHFNWFIEIQDIWDVAKLGEMSADDAEAALEDFHKYVKGVNKPPAKQKTFLRHTIQIAATILLAAIFSISYEWVTSHKTPTEITSKSYTQISVPSGNRSQITLPDGTKVWLNSNTSLRYAAAFDDKNRKVYLDGEAYLDVAKDPNRPFYVETSTITLKVLGTSFNVKSYRDENTVETTLIEGSLKVLPNSAESKRIKEIILKPNEKATFKKDESSLLIDKLDIKTPVNKEKPTLIEKTGTAISQVESIISWKDNELIFRNETLEEICIKMERWYGISISIEDTQLKNMGYRYSGKFIYNETVNQVMDILSLTTSIKYKLDKNVLIIRGTN